MATEEELFISIDPEIYRSAKAQNLMSQADLLQTLRHLQNLKILSRKKNDLKIKLQKLLSVIISKMNTLEKKMPTSDFPEVVKEYEKLREPKSEKPKRRTITKRDSIEEELKLINEKLQELNAAV